MLTTADKVKLKQRGTKKNHVFRGVTHELGLLINSFRNVIVYFDPDVDGCIAGSLVCRYLAKRGIAYQWYINSNRSHDWSLGIDKVRGKDIIAVDFIIREDKVKELVDAGCNLVSMDHHHNQEEFINIYGDKNNIGLVINNQYPFEEDTSRYLSGAGVVFETLIELDPSFDTDENRSLVGITLLSDVRDIENPYAEYYLSTLYGYKYKGYIKYLIDGTMGDKDFGFGLPRMDRNYVDYKFSPAINSMLRFNRQDEVVNFFLGKGNLDLECREAQKRLVKELVKVIKLVKFRHLKVCYFQEQGFEEYSEVLSSFVGLTASRYLEDGKSVICYMIAYDSDGKPYVKRASFRGNVNGLDYRNALSEQFQCLGHASAFGIKGIKPGKELFKQCDNICGIVDKESGWHRKVLEISNMSFFVGKKAKSIAEDNMYKLVQNQTYIKYIGGDIKQKRGTPSYQEYLVNGIPVKCFDKDINFSNGLIVPILDRGLLSFILQ